MIKKIQKALYIVYAKMDKMLARALGALMCTASATIVAYADDGGGGAWSSIVSWLNTNKSGLEYVAKALIGVCLVAAVICIAIGGSQGMSKVKNWLIGLAVAVILLVFGQSFLDSLYKLKPKNAPECAFGRMKSLIVLFCRAHTICRKD